MHRRSFLKFLLSTPLAAVVDYEKLLWVPGEKTIFIPSPKQVEFLNMILERPIEAISARTMRIPLTLRPSGDWSGFDEPVSYETITLNEAIKTGHVRPYEIESITNFMNRVNKNA